MIIKWHDVHKVIIVRPDPYNQQPYYYYYSHHYYYLKTKTAIVHVQNLLPGKLDNSSLFISSYPMGIFSKGISSNVT
jgi:hypothetical protein